MQWGKSLDGSAFSRSPKVEHSPASQASIVNVQGCYLVATGRHFRHSSQQSQRQACSCRDIPVDYRRIVPYNPMLVTKYNAHINVEIVASFTVVKYLFKRAPIPDATTCSVDNSWCAGIAGCTSAPGHGRYIFKNPDCAVLQLHVGATDAARAPAAEQSVSVDSRARPACGPGAGGCARRAHSQAGCRPAGGPGPAVGACALILCSAAAARAASVAPTWSWSTAQSGPLKMYLPGSGAEVQAAMPAHHELATLQVVASDTGRA